MATFRIEVGGDADLDACNVVLRLDVPAGFEIAATRPQAAASSDDGATTLRYPAIARIRPGESVVLEVDLVAPEEAAAGALCARLTYADCAADGAADLTLGPECLDLEVAALAPAGGDLSFIPCGSSPAVSAGGGTFDESQWSDASFLDLATSVRVYAKTSLTDLYVAVRVEDPTIDVADSVKLFVNTNADGGNPEAGDRGFLVDRTGAGAEYGGRNLGYDVPRAASFTWEVAELAGAWAVEMRIPLGELGGPVDAQDVKLGFDVRNAGAPGLWPPAFNGVNEGPMFPSTIDYCAAITCRFTTWAQFPDDTDPDLGDRQLLYDDIDGPNGTWASLSMIDGWRHRTTGFQHFGSTGTITRVQVLLHLYLESAVNDQLEVSVFWNGAERQRITVLAGTLNQYVGPASAGTLALDLSGALNPWLISHFDPGADLDIQVRSKRQGSSDGVRLDLDAIGFEVQTTGACNAASGAPDVFVAKDNGFSTLVAGQYFVYQVAYGNRGSATATDVVLSDVLPGNVSWWVGQGSASAPTVTVASLEYSTDGLAWSPVTAAAPPDGTAGVQLRLRADLLPADPARTYLLRFGVRVDPLAARGDLVQNQAAVGLVQADGDLSDNSDWDDGAQRDDDAGDRVGDFATPSFTVPCDPAVPALDGRVSASEYAMAALLTASRPATSPLEGMLVYAYHDRNYLYVGFDVDDPDRRNADLIELGIDVDSDRVDPDDDDRRYRIRRDGNTTIYRGQGDNSDGLGWTSPAASGAVLLRAERADASGWMAEMRIPLAELAGVSGTGETVGLAFWSDNSEPSRVAAYPSFALVDNLSSWAGAALASCTPVARFQALPDCARAAIQFTDQSTGSPTAWRWFFGDGTPIVTVPSPTHAYSFAGVYNVTLEACNWAGCNQIAKQIQVFPLPIPRILPVSGSSCIDPAIATSIALDGVTSLPGFGASLLNPGGFSWSTDLGSVSGSPGAAATLTAAAGIGGPATVTLTVTDTRQCSASTTARFDLNQPPAAALAAPAETCGDRDAAVDVPLDGSATVFFAGSSASGWGWSPPPGTSIVGSGPVVGLRVPAATFPGGMVDLTVTASNGCTDSAQAPVQILEPPLAALADVTVCSDESAPFAVALDATATAPGASPIPADGYSWSAAPGTLGGSSGPSETLTLPAGFVGSVLPCVDVADQRSCRHRACGQVEVRPLPTADFAVQLPSDCADPDNPMVVTLDASVSGWILPIAEPSGYAWIASPGTLSAASGKVVTLTLPAGFAGPVDVTLTVAGDPSPCARSISRRFEIHPGPIADFDLPIASRCTDPAAAMDLPLDASLSSSPDGIVSWSWSASAGAVVDDPAAPVTTLRVPAGHAGTVTVTLEVEDGAGCRRQLSHEVRFDPPPVAALAVPGSRACDRDGSGATLDLDASASASAALPLVYAWSSSTPLVTVTPTSPSGDRARLAADPTFLGLVTVRVTVTDGNGCQSFAEQTIEVAAGPSAAIAAEALRLCAPGAERVLRLDGSSSASPNGIDDPAGYAWSATAALTSPTGSVTAITVPAGLSGPIDVTLTVTDRLGCSAARTERIVVVPLPVAAIAALPAACSADSPFSLVLDGSAATGATALVGHAWSVTPPAALAAASGTVTALEVPAGFVGAIDVTLAVTDGDGCLGSVTRRIDIHDRPLPVLAADRGRGCDGAGGTDFVLDATGSISLAPPLSFAWSVPAPATVAPLPGAGAVLSVPAGATGVATVTVAVTDSFGCSRSTDLTVNVDPQPTAVIVAPVAGVCSPASSPSEALLDGRLSAVAAPDAVAEYRWTVDPPGAVAPATGPTTRVTFPAGSTGTFNAFLEVETTSGCTATAAAPLTVRADVAPVARLTTPAMVVCADPSLPTVIPLDASGSVAFPPATLSDPGAFSWWASLGSLTGSAGSRETLRLPAGTFGTVRVRVDLSDSRSCGDAAEIEVLVLEPPLAMAAVVPPQACEAGAVFALDSLGSASRHPSDSSLAFLWTASEPGLSSPSSPAPVFRPARLELARDPSFTLTVVDAAGCTSPPASVQAHVDPSPTAAFTAAVVAVGQTSSFSARPLGGTPGYTYAWDFGDGLPSSTDAAPGHVYAAAGSYTVTLEIRDAAGCTASASQAIAIGPGLAGSVATSRVCAGETTWLAASISGGTPPHAFSWLLGDGPAIATAAPSLGHRYAAAGTYPVSVEVRDAGGQTLTLGTSAEVMARPSVDAATSGPALAGVEQAFTATTSDPSALLEWTFSDGARASGAAVRHVFATSGAHRAGVTATADTGCVGEDSVEIEIAAGSTTVAFAKTASALRVLAGEEVEYALTIANGEGWLRDLTVDDHLPPGFLYRPGTLSRDGTPLPEPAGSTDLTFALPDLAPDASTVIRYRVAVGAEVAPGRYDNSATLSALDPGSRPLLAGPRTAAVTVVPGEPRPEPGTVDLRVRKRADADPDPPLAGGLVRYAIEYENLGSATATAVRIEDDWPASLATVEENGDGGLVLGNRIEWQVGNVSPGGAGRVQYALRLGADLPSGTAIRNLVAAAAREEDANPEDNRALSELAVGGSPDLVLTKSVVTAPDPAGPGAEATYTLAWHNAGSGVAPAASVRDDYDESKLEIVAGPAGGVDAGGVLEIALGDVAPGARGSVTYTARLRGGAQGAVENRAEASSALADRNPADNAASARFDVVTSPATLALRAEIRTGERCREPQVEVALKSDRFDTAGAMLAAAEFLRAARGARPALDPLLAGPVEVLRGRLEAFGRLNVESLLLDSGMGIPWRGRGEHEVLVGWAAELGLERAPELPAPISLPFASAHPFFAERRDLDEPWCRHEAHLFTTPEAAGHTLAAIAAYLEGAAEAHEPETGFVARVLRAEAAEAVALLLSWREAGVAGQGPARLPARIDLQLQADRGFTAGAGDPGPSPRGEAALARGIARLLLVGGEKVAAAGLEEPARALLVRLLEDLAAGEDVLAEQGRFEVATVALAAEAVEAARAAGAAVPPVLEKAVTASFARLAPAPEAGGFAASVDPASAVRTRPTLASEVSGIRAALALGERATAERAFERLERDFLEPRLRLYRSDTGSATVDYTAELLGAVVAALARLAEGASSTAAARIEERLSTTIQKVAVEAGLQTDLVGRRPDGDGQRLILSADGGVKIAPAFADAPHALAPVLVDRVTFLPQGIHHRDLSRVEGARGVREDASVVHFLSGRRAACQAAQVRLLDRRFVTESGLFAIAGMESAGAALAARGRRGADAWLTQFGGELMATAAADRAALALLSGMGVRLAHAPGVGGEAGARALLATYRRAAGLEQLAAALPVWLELGSGDPAFVTPVDPASPYAAGWDPSRFLPELEPAAFAGALLADVRTAAAALERDRPLARLLALLRLHAATLKVELAEREIGAKGDLPRLGPVLDAEGAMVDLGRAGGTEPERGRAALLEALLAYRSLPHQRIRGWVVDGAPPPLALEAASRLARKLYPRVLDQASRGDDPLALLHATRALAAWAAAGGEGAEEALAGARLAAARLAAGVPEGDLSPLAVEAMALEAAALAGLGEAEVGERYRALRDRFYDRAWRIFRTGVAAEGEGEAFVLTDRDVGAVLSALGAALGGLRLSEAEEAADLLYTAAGRMLFETGLQRSQRLELEVAGERQVAWAPSLSRAVRVAFSAAAGEAGSVYPGDFVEAVLSVANPTPSSVADESAVLIESGSLTYVAGSARIDGKAAAEPLSGSSLTFALGRLGGGQAAELRFLLRVDPGTRAGRHALAARVTGKSAPGPSGQPLAPAGSSAAVEVGGFGAIAGRIAIDLDRDGVHGPGDAGLPEATVVLGDGTASTSDADGRFRLDSLVPSDYLVRLADGSLPTGIKAAAAESRARVRAGETAEVSFLVPSSDVVTGIVFRDLDGDRRMDPGEPVVRGVVVEMSGGQRSVTDRTGRYLIRGVSTGSHELAIARRQPYVEDTSDLRVRPLPLPASGERAARGE